ncbi:MAG TPA: endonuclease, partial [Flavobacteriales bacterium]|nr:endonuclease [Flavobacteriales bacterium]
EELRTALYEIISPHTVISYSNLWNAFEVVDQKVNGKVWDIYSDVPSGTPAYEFTFGVDQCGNYSAEGDCFNREHSFPESWFNGASPMYSDLFHIYPTDGWVNNKRANWPYGTVSSPTWTSTNGSKLGPCSAPGCSGTVFEPIDAYKGDLARGYFYMLTRYLPDVDTWPCPMMTAGNFSPWAENLLLSWNELDPVSQKEIDRNNGVYQLQGNRNPYIDNPQWINSIWVSTAGVEEARTDPAQLWYSEQGLNVVLRDVGQGPTLTVLDMTGRTVLTETVRDLRTTVAIDVPAGIYLAALSSPTQRSVLRFVR